MEDFYKDWLFRQYDKWSEYTGVLSALYEKEFIYMNDMDKNLSLDANITRWNYSGVIDSRQSNCLEVIYILAVKLNRMCYTLRISDWIDIMLGNLGLLKFPDNTYSPERVASIIETWLCRGYRPDGLGSLFYLKDSTDMNYMNIWLQANRYLQNLLNKGVV